MLAETEVEVEVVGERRLVRVGRQDWLLEVTAGKEG